MGVKRRTSEPARSLRRGASSVGGGARRTVATLRREAKTAPVEAAATLRGPGVAKAAEGKYTTKIVLACIDTTRTRLVFARVSVWFYSLPPLRRRLLLAEQTRTRRLLRFAVQLPLPSARLRAIWSFSPALAAPPPLWASSSSPSPGIFLAKLVMSQLLG